MTDELVLRDGTRAYGRVERVENGVVTPKVQVYSGKAAQVSVGVMHFLNVGDGSLGIA